MDLAYTEMAYFVTYLYPLLTLAVRRVPKTEQRSLNLVAFDNHPTCDLVVLSSFPKTILTHDTKGWKHIVNMCVYGERFTTLTLIRTSCSVFGSDFYIEKHFVFRPWVRLFYREKLTIPYLAYVTLLTFCD